MSLYGDIRAGIVSSLSSLGVQSTGYLVASPTPPVIEVYPGEVNYDDTLQRGVDTALFMVRVSVATSLDRGAQERLDEYLGRTGAASVKALVEADRTLGGVVKDLRVESATGHQVASVEGTLVLSATWSVRVYL